MLAKGLAEGIATKVGRAKFDSVKMRHRTMHTHEVRFRTNDSKSPLAGRESAEGELYRDIPVGDIVSPNGRAASLREAIQEPMGTKMHTRGVLKLNSPDGIRIGKYSDHETRLGVRILNAIRDSVR